MKHLRTILDIRKNVDALQHVPDGRLRKASLNLKYRAMTGAKIGSLITEGFALVVEAARRGVSQTHYDVQLCCGIEMASGKIAEMRTGEGKTLTASLIAYLYAIYGRGMHAVTFNDYLAERDCKFLSPIFDRLGLTSGYLTGDQPPEQRSLAYRHDVTFGSAKEFGFDFLRDRLTIARTGNARSGIMRGTHFALVDEADSILIDEARTPLIIGMVNESEELVAQQCFRWAAKHSSLFDENRDFTYDHLRQSVKLTSQGIRKTRSLPEDQGTKQVSILQLYTHIKNAIKVRRDFHLDKNYTVINGEIVIIDEFTGRPAEGRQWQQGIHQAVQAKEKLEITPATQQAATITIQSFFNRYTCLCGMTGTAFSSKREFKKVYKKRVVRIPTHRPTDRTELPPKVFPTIESKFEAITQEVVQMVAAGRAVLIGNRTVDASEQLSEFLTREGVDHDVLNARYIEKEAGIVEFAGQPGCVTVATNMAGRGTDIKLHASVRTAGGLHVIITELHESRRIDWQLIGRGSRQGDPGSFRIFVSLEDEILQIGLGAARAKRLQKKFATDQGALSSEQFQILRKAQRIAERRYLVDRLMVLKSDQERQKMHFDTGQDPYLSTVMS